MKAQWILMVACVAALGVVGCKDDSTGGTTDGGTDMGGGNNDMGGGTDMGGGGDAGRDMGPRTDMGGADPCQSDGEGDLTAFVGCNGPVIGASAAENTFGGPCTGATPENPAGTCTATGAICASNEGAATGVCLQGCTASETFYTTTSECPSGSRCFALDTGVCFPDCNTGTDCLSGTCDGEGSCTVPEAVVTDGGVPDASTDDAGPDVDAGPADAGPAEDAGPVAALVVPCEGATIAQTVTASVGEGFAPTPASVVIGAVVQFTNADSFAHTVTSATSPEGEPVASGLFDAALAGSSSVCIMFNSVGSYPYFCNIHTSMRGVVNVGEP